MNSYLRETILLDYSNNNIQELLEQRQWNNLGTIARIKSIYTFVRDEIKFGYNTADDLPASEILKDGYGQCNTKATLLMALLRAVGIPNRIHGFTINKSLQKGAITGIWYFLSPQNILHSWVEILLDGRWYFLEGVILDKPYLQHLQKMYSGCAATFCGYGVYTDNFSNPPIDWDLNNTFIQAKGINQDFGVFDTPDQFYVMHQQKLGVLKRFMFRNVVRHFMNANVQKIRGGTF